ncbi:hypothetical protein M407DRAFT_219439 [Tulasnella calospora MUT 4182]|uniref:F-box domain-containing protein n=1 Tax=Tulasnella calospora MUT 4182 TaxID=1051891 RepID=A0A0C3QA94_9AGAM|nr:hypothetical protein M407DRAFT_219439 [Tulasnella calospora MUT 4182]
MKAKRPVAQLLDVSMRHLKPILISLTSGAQEYSVTISYDGLEIAIGGLRINLTSTNVTWLTLLYETLFEYEHDLIDMIPLLSRPTSGPSPIWLLPQLEVFETDLVRTEDDRIVDMIKARHAVLPESFPGLHGPPPKRLREIRLSLREDTSPTPSSIETFMSEGGSGRNGHPQDLHRAHHARDDTKMETTALSSSLYQARDISRGYLDATNIRFQSKLTRYLAIDCAFPPDLCPTVPQPFLIARALFKKNGYNMPVHDRIPREIFETILHLCVGFDTPVRDLVTLQLVCRTWHDIIAEASSLWGTVSAGEGSRAFHKAFRMAENSRLDIIFTDEGVIEASEFFSLTGKKIDQWRSLAIEADRMEEALAIIRTHKPPNLNLLSVASGRYISSERVKIVLFGGAPATGLKHFKLIRAPIDIPSLHLSGLTSLLLQDIPSITAAEIITILNSSPTLKSLHLIGSDGMVPPTKPATDEPLFSLTSPIQLAFLIDLKLHSLPLPLLNFLLSNFAVPQLHSFEVYTIKAKQPVAQLLDVGMRHLKPALISLTSGAQEYNVTVSYIGKLEIAIRRLRIDLTSPVIGIHRFHETFNWLSEHLEGVALADMPLHLTLTGWEPAPMFLEWFTHRTNVTWLTLSNETLGDIGYGLVDMIPLLGRPTSGPSPIWLLPQLEVFETDLACTESQRLIVNMVKARHAALPESSTGSYGALPTRFREIRLSDQGDKSPTLSSMETFMSEVIQAAEGAEVYWAGRKWTEWLSARVR